jgi:adenylosuccinate synthase
MVCGVDSMALTKLDVLGGQPVIRVCTSYRLNGKTDARFPADAEEIDQVEPVYEDLEGWDDDLSGARSVEDLPKPARAYVRAIEEVVGARVSAIGIGRDREEIIRS